MRTIAVVGASVAGTRAARSLRDAGFDGRLVLVGDDDRTPYDRPPLSKGFLAGTQGEADLALLDTDDEAELALELRLGARVERLDAHAGRLRLADGARDRRADGVVVATGGRPRRLPGCEGSAALRVCTCCAPSTTPSRCGPPSPTRRRAWSSSGPGSSARRSPRPAAGWAWT